MPYSGQEIVHPKRQRMSIPDRHRVSHLPLTFSQLRSLSLAYMESAVVVEIEDRLVGGAQAEVTQSVGRAHYQDRRGWHLR